MAPPIANSWARFRIDIVYGVALIACVGYLATVDMEPLVVAFTTGLIAGYVLRVWEKMSIYRDVVAQEAEDAVATELDDQVDERVGTQLDEQLQERVEREIDAQVTDHVEEEFDAQVADQLEEKLDEQIADRVESELDEQVDPRVEEAIEERTDGGVSS